MEASSWVTSRKSHVSVLAQPLVDTAFHRLSDDGEVAVSQVEEEFFHRTPHLDERMPPGIGLVETLLVVDVLDDVTRMTQREVQFVSLHREYSAISLRSRLNTTAEMRGVVGEAKIVDEILAWHDGKS